MLDGRWRTHAERALDPVGKALHRARVNADVLTLVGLAFSVATAWLIAGGRHGLAVVGIALTGVPDILDGTVARHSGKAGPRGAFFDSVCDRVSDAVLLGGAAWYLAGESAHLPILALAAVALSMLISYERAKAEALGFSARGGLMERAERLVLLAAGLAFGVLVAALWVMVALSVVTAVHRFFMVWRQATPERAHERSRLPRLGVRRPRHPRPAGQLELTGSPRTRRIAEWWATRQPGGRAPRPRRRTRP